MLGYRPPKSSIWGHTLGRMRSARVLELVDRFLGEAVGEHGFASASLSVTAGIPTTPEGEALLDQVGRSFANLDHAQYARVLEALLAWEAKHGEQQAPIVLSRALALKGWRIGDAIAPAPSMLMVYVGHLPALSTMFSFETLEQFEHVRGVMAELGLCKLNPKHLKAQR